jgi:hypothetical protein
MRPWGGEASERRGLLGGWGGALRMRDREGRSILVAGLCGSCGQRRLWFITAAAGDARRGEGAMRGLVWFGFCSEYERVLPLVRDDAALRRRGVGATGPPGWMGRGSAHAASGWFGRCGPRGLAGVAGMRPSGLLRRRRGDAWREEGGMRGLVWFGLRRTYERLLPLVRDDAALGVARRWSDGASWVDGEGQCAFGIGMLHAVRAVGLCGSFKQRCRG